jgi:hypothetical protein
VSPVMGVMDGEGHRAVFIVRLARDPRGQVTGVLERRRTGEKARIDGLVDVGGFPRRCWRARSGRRPGRRTEGLGSWTGERHGDNAERA